MNRWELFVIVGLVIGSISPAVGDDSPYLRQGQFILPKHPHMSVRVGDVTIGDEMDFDWPLFAERVNGQWLWIRDDGRSSPVGQPRAGWVSKDDVIMLNGDPIEKIGAIDYFTRIIERDPNNAWAFLFRGIAWAQRTDWRVARGDLKKATELDPTLDLGWANRGYCEYKLAGRNNKQLFDRVNKHQQLYLEPFQIPNDLRNAIEHFQRAVALRERPSTLVYWANALSTDYWSPFQRQVYNPLFENPELFDEQAPLVNQTDGLTEHSALLLYRRALDIFPKCDEALYGEAGMYASVIDYRIWKMTQSEPWKALKWAVEYREIEKQMPKAAEKAGTLLKNLDQVEARFNAAKLAAMRAGDRRLIEQRSTKLAADYNQAANELDAAEDKVAALDKQHQQQFAKFQNGGIARFPVVYRATAGSNPVRRSLGKLP